MNEDQTLSEMGIDKHIHSLSQLRDFSRREQWYLLCITIIGASIRLLYLHDKPFFGDEVGTVIYIEKDISYLLSHFAIWLSMNYFIVMEKLVAGLFGKSMFSLGFVPLVAGVWTIPLTAFLAARFASPRIALIAATLTCMNPYLMEYSGIIRSYSLLTALSLLVMILFLKWLTVRSYKNGIWVG